VIFSVVVLPILIAALLYCFWRAIRISGRRLRLPFRG